jgi:hypothetical protein
MSSRLDSVSQHRWIESTSHNKDSLNRWLRSCRSIQYQHVDLEYKVFRAVQRRRFLAVKRGYFRDWKCLTLIAMNAGRWRMSGVLQVMAKRTWFRKHIIRQLERAYSRCVCVAFRQWLHSTIYLRNSNNKQRFLDLRNQADQYLKRLGVTARFLGVWQGSLLRIKMAHSFYKWNLLASAGKVIGSRRTKSMKKSIFSMWQRVWNRREAARAFDSVVLKWVARTFACLRDQPPILKQTLQLPSPRMSPAKSSPSRELLERQSATTEKTADNRLQCNCM